MISEEIKSATISADKLYRYTLLRKWSDKPTYGFIGLNPSTADELKDDATIRKCKSFVNAWGGGGLLMLNLFAWRATQPLELLKERKLGQNIIGPMNTRVALVGYIKACQCPFVIAAWGTNSNKFLRDEIRNRASEVTMFLKSAGIEMKYLNGNTDGSPQHPLYIPLSMPLHSM